MICRLVSACLGAVAFVGLPGMPARTLAKPPDLPMNETITAAPQAAPEAKQSNTGSLIFSIGANSNSGLTGSIAVNERNFDVVQTSAKSIYDSLPAAVPTPALYQLRPTARRMLTGSVLFSVNPLLSLLPTEQVLDAPDDHPQKVAGDDVVADAPASEPIWNKGLKIENGASDEMLPMPQEDKPATTAADGVTCPYLRQKYLDRHACQLADPEIGHDVLDNLARLKKAEMLLELAEKLAQTGDSDEALQCCVQAQALCAGSPCADRAADVMLDVCFGADKPATEEAAEEQAETSSDPYSKAEPGVEQQVEGLMKACRLLVNEGLHEQAAEFARQAFALDPERVMADPLLYKMHLLADAPAKPSAGSSEASEPPSCPYCPHGGKPISEIVPEKKTTESGPSTLLVPPLPPIDYEVVPALDRVLTEQTESAAGAEEASEDDMPSSLQELVESIMGPSQTLLGVSVNAEGGLRVISAYPLGNSVYHLQYNRGCLAIWKTPDAAKTKP